MTTSQPQPAETTRCPVCGHGTLTDLAFDAAPGGREQMQTADSKQLTIYSCGHRVQGASLAGADEDRLDVERRGAAETVDPPVSDTEPG